jgi:nucleotide-binding universal stress UspA family protein
MMKLLLAFDGSEPAENALKDLAWAGLPANTQARILTVIPPILPQEALLRQPYAMQGFPDTFAEVVVRNRLKSESNLMAKASAASRNLKRMFGGWKIAVECVKGAPPQEILKRADGYKPDLIVMGSRGWTLTGKLLIGSVAEKVLLHSRWNTRIGKGKTRKLGPPRLLIGFDGSKESMLAVEAVADRDWPKGTLVQITAVTGI